MLEVAFHRQSAELHFAPKAPRFFGWKALKLSVKLYGEAPEIHLGVVTPDIVDAQLHCIRLNGVEVVAAEYIKKHNNLLDNLRSMQPADKEERLLKRSELRFKLGEGFYFEFDEVSNGFFTEPFKHR